MTLYDLQKRKSICQILLAKRLGYSAFKVLFLVATEMYTLI